jgi:hypothetical protein
MAAHRVLLGSVVAEFLGPMVSQSRVIKLSIVPWLLELQDSADTYPSTGPSKLTQTLMFLEAVLDESEVRALANGLFARLALCSMSSKLSLNLPGSLPFVKLAAELMRLRHFGGALRAWKGLPAHIERLLLVRRPPSHELKNMLPKVCIVTLSHCT